MFNFKQLVRKALLACALACVSGASLAGPNYLVTIHTQAYSGESGLLDFAFLGEGGVSDIATLSNFSGAFGAEFDRFGEVGGNLSGALTFGNTGNNNYLTQEVLLGGDFAFNISFSDNFANGGNPDDAIGSIFGVTLYDAFMSDTLAMIVQFDLVPANAGDEATIIVKANADLAIVGLATDVPEPSQLLLMLSALALAGIAGRRRKNAASGFPPG